MSRGCCFHSCGDSRGTVMSCTCCRGPPGRTRDQQKLLPDRGTGVRSTGGHSAQPMISRSVSPRGLGSTKRQPQAFDGLALRWRASWRPAMRRCRCAESGWLRRARRGLTPLRRHSRGSGFPSFMESSMVMGAAFRSSANPAMGRHLKSSCRLPKAHWMNRAAQQQPVARMAPMPRISCSSMMKRAFEKDAAPIYGSRATWCAALRLLSKHSR